MIIQLVGILLTLAGLIALTAASRLFGRPLTRDERNNMGKEARDVYRLPLNLETIVSGAIFLGGIGILTWTKFNLCTFLSAWLPDLPLALRLLLSCQ